MDTDRLPHLITNYQTGGKWSQGRPPKDFSKVNGTKEVTRPKPCKLYDDGLAAHLRKVINIYPHFSSNVGKFVLEQAMKAQKWSSHIALLFL